MHSKTHTFSAGILATKHWKSWRNDVARAHGTVALITGHFAFLHPGNLAAIREAARHASHVCVILDADEAGFKTHNTATGSVTTPVPPTSAMPDIAVRMEMIAALRAVTMVSACSKTDTAALECLRPFTLVDCIDSKSPGNIAAAARKVADSSVNLAPVPGCWTADIQEAIRNAQTPIPVPDLAFAPPHDYDNLDQFLSAAADGATGRPLVTVNGCFDVLHLGHLRLLAQAAKMGKQLLVLVNDDDSVRAYKGKARPIFPLRFRLHALDALNPVALAYPFTGDNPLSLLARIRPDIHVKGGSFEESRVRAERRLVESWGGRLEIVPLVNGFSTTGVVRRMTDAG